MSKKILIDKPIKPRHSKTTGENSCPVNKEMGMKDGGEPLTLQSFQCRYFFRCPEEEKHLPGKNIIIIAFSRNASFFKGHLNLVLVGF